MCVNFAYENNIRTCAQNEKGELMADAKKTTKSTTDIAQEREKIVRQANEQQKRSAKQSRSTKSSSETSVKASNANVVRDKSLEEKYLEKFKSGAKKTSSTTTKAKTGTTVTKTSTAQPKASSKNSATAIKVAQKSTKTNAEQDIRIGNVVVDKEIANQKTGIISSKKDRQKMFVVITLSILLALTVLLSAIFIIGSLSKESIGTLKVNGNGIEWLINGKADDSFGVRGEIFPGCSIQDIKIELKKTTNSNIRVKVVIDPYYKGDIVPKEEYNIWIRTLDSANNKFEERNGDYYIDDWNATVNGNTTTLCEVINISDALTEVNNDNFKLVFTVYVESI